MSTPAVGGRFIRKIKKLAAAKAIALMPGDLVAYLYAGDARLEMGDYAGAQKFYDRLADPADGKPHPGLAYLAASHGASLCWVEGKVEQKNCARTPR